MRDVKHRIVYSAFFLGGGSEDAFDIVPPSPFILFFIHLRIKQEAQMCCDMSVEMFSTAVRYE